ncbi:MAG: hypothetical protein CMH49_01925, partial [Myxococcales bacterium]|nr:hypothetical protein [Myxococcales bacterium]
RVLSADAQPAELQEVFIFIEGSERSTVTDKRGFFRLTTVSQGPFILHFDALNHESKHLKLSALDIQSPLLVSLSRASEELNSVTVVAVKSQPETSSVTRLSARDISFAPRRNAEEILRQVPGLTLVQHGSEGKGHQFFMRGFDAVHGTDLELTVDGVPINEWSNIHAQGYLDLAMIMPEMVQSVMVNKGPFTLEQGAFGMAGSADYRLGVPRTESGWRIAYTAGTTNRHRLFAGYASPENPNKNFVGVGATHDDGFGVNRALKRSTFNGRTELLDFNGGGSLTLTGLGNYSSFELPSPLRNDDVQVGLIDFYGAYDSRSKGLSKRATLVLNYAQERDDDKLSLSVYGGYRELDLLENFTGFLINPEDGDRRDQYQQTSSFGFFGTYESELVKHLALRVGFGLRGDRFLQNESNVDQSLEVLSPRRDLSGLQLISHTLAGLRWLPHRKLRVDVGTRVDVIDVKVSDHLNNHALGKERLTVASPRLTATWKPIAHWMFSLAYGRGFRPPEARAFSSFNPQQFGIGEEVLFDTKAVATSSDAIELGMRWIPSKSFKTVLSGFATFIARESIFDHVSSTSLELNGTRRLGGELVMSVKPLAWLSIQSDLTLVDARFTDSNKRVPLAPWLVSGIRTVISGLNGFQAGLRILTVAPRTLPHGASGASLLMSDATITYKWDRIVLGLELENLLNRQLREGEYHYASAWSPDEVQSKLPTLHTTAGPVFNARLTLKTLF